MHETTRGDADASDGSVARHTETVAGLRSEIADLEHRFSRLRGFLDAISSGYWDWNIATGRVDFSDKWLESLGYNREDCDGTVAFWEKCVHPDDMPIVFRHVQEHFHKKTGFYSCENRLRTKAGQYRPNVDSGLVVEWDPAGNPTRMVGTDTDMSKLEAVEHQLRHARHDLELKVELRTHELGRSNAALARSNEELRRFAVAASHDLQEPLRQLVAFAQLVREQCGDQQPIARHAEHIVTSGKRMREMVRGLLDYARCGRELTTTTCSFNEVLREVQTDLGTLIAETRAEIEVSGDAEVVADKSGLRIVLHNLITNAIKYRGSGSPQIELRVDESGAEWHIFCTDHGIGVAPEHCESIFELFQRLHAHDSIPGSGMGLATARRIVEAHGGRLWLEKESAPGTRFIFTLPKASTPRPNQWGQHAR